ncbi:hypothetical protein PNK_0893 [Candidatus Protochlamydia naegleriophila]|uniref:Pyridoxal phosphate homeostasis protein n=1 Tax=Candidatus Protochlamydia naegleriophila TaxID=389348 RepID=A0A0U5JFI2_9BACT|nr:YggS family pyridoxal phosphate-dependent enzyme [Candidatus Protochlamydia naegleriophila]CUI16518.1 hypothetical protein PNK_0893 [Candidatus Protochlamydia naegleriophila]
MMESIADRYRMIQDSIWQRAMACGRKPEEVALIAVTKTHPPSFIQEAYQAGGRHFGENRVQELLPKIPALPNDCNWHLIGSLQSNKVGKVLDSSIKLIHSVDSLALAEKIAFAGQARQKETPILLQVNISGEASKHGFSQECWEAVLERVAQLPALRIEGLMTIAPFTNDQVLIRSCFKALAHLRDKWKGYMQNPAIFSHLSMGMTNDYEIAIEEGATLVRIGSAIFGGRPLVRH